MDKLDIAQIVLKRFDSLECKMDSITSRLNNLEVSQRVNLDRINQINRSAEDRRKKKIEVAIDRRKKSRRS